jgi:putative phosphoribosyl transferase
MRRVRRWLTRLSHLFDKTDVVFADRREAGLQLAAALMRLKERHPVVLGLPRGGVPVGFEVAQALDAPLDVVLVRKIGAPGHPELGLGAVVEGEAEPVLNDDVVRLVAPDPAYLEAEKRRQLAEIDRRKQLYRGGRPPLAVDGRVAIVVDDGIATGGTVKAVLRALARAKAHRLVLAVPVAPQESIEALAGEADEVVCLATPDPFFAVGAHYRDFSQTTDQEVVDLLRVSAARRSS